MHERSQDGERPAFPNKTQKTQLLLAAAEGMNLGFHFRPDGQD